MTDRLTDAGAKGLLPSADLLDRLWALAHERGAELAPTIERRKAA